MYLHSASMFTEAFPYTLSAISVICTITHKIIQQNSPHPRVILILFSQANDVWSFLSQHSDRTPNPTFDNIDRCEELQQVVLVDTFSLSGSDTPSSSSHTHSNRPIAKTTGSYSQRIILKLISETVNTITKAY